LTPREGRLHELWFDFIGERQQLDPEELSRSVRFHNQTQSLAFGQSASDSLLVPRKQNEDRKDLMFTYSAVTRCKTKITHDA
jgi:ABC-type iron transport system FetAB ATPase subunit